MTQSIEKTTSPSSPITLSGLCGSVVKKRRFFTILELLIAIGLTAMLLTILTGFFQQVQWLDSQADKEQTENFKIRYAENRLAKVLMNALSENTLKKHFYFFTGSDMHGLLAPENPSLVFVFSNGPSMDYKLANEALGRIYLDKQNHLCLATWPAPARWKRDYPESAKNEILLDNVEKLAFQFYVAPERNRELIKTTRQQTPVEQPPQDTTNKKNEKNKGKNSEPKPEASNDVKPQVADEEKALPIPQAKEWVDEWPMALKQLPPMVKVIVTRKKATDKEAQEITFAFPLMDSPKLIVYEQ